MGFFSKGVSVIFFLIFVIITGVLWVSQVCYAILLIDRHIGTREVIVNLFRIPGYIVYLFIFYVIRELQTYE